jgi:hypothetical protein
MEQGESGKKRQVNLPKTRFTVEDKRRPLTKNCHFLKENRLETKKLSQYNSHNQQFIEKY